MANMGDSHLIVDLVRTYLGSDVRRGAEIGVHRGATSAKLLAAFRNLTLVMVDPWCEFDPMGSYAATRDGCARFTKDDQLLNYQVALEATEAYASRRIVQRMTSEEAAQVPFGFDFVFIDAEHSYEAVKRDIGLWYPKIRSGGLLAGHDYGHPKNARGLFGVDRAVDEFFKETGLLLRRSGSCWGVVK